MAFVLLNLNDNWLFTRFFTGTKILVPDFYAENVLKFVVGRDSVKTHFENIVRSDLIESVAMVHDLNVCLTK